MVISLDSGLCGPREGGTLDIFGQGCATGTLIPFPILGHVQLHFKNLL